MLLLILKGTSYRNHVFWHRINVDDDTMSDVDETFPELPFSDRVVEEDGLVFKRSLCYPDATAVI